MAKRLDFEKAAAKGVAKPAESLSKVGTDKRPGSNAPAPPPNDDPDVALGKLLRQQALEGSIPISLAALDVRVCIKTLATCLPSC